MFHNIGTLFSGNRSKFIMFHDTNAIYGRILGFINLKCHPGLWEEK